MRYLIAFLFSSALFGQAWPNGYSYRAAVTVQAGQVTGTLSSFPVLIHETRASWKTVGNGGKVQNTVACGCASGITVPADWKPTTSSGTALNGEFSKYDATTGEVIFHVAATISDGTTIYVYYGNASVTTVQFTPTSTWDSNFVGVYHLPNGSVLTANDSTVSANNGTLENTPTATTGPTNLDGAAAFVTASSQDINIGNSASLNVGDTITVEAWINPTNLTQRNGIVSYRKNNATSSWQFEVGNVSASTATVAVVTQNVGGNWITNNNTATAATWQHVAFTKDGSALTIYVNGVSQSLQSTGTASNAFADNTEAKYIGQINANLWYSGAIDEVRISKVVRTAAWIQSDYNSQNAPSSFYAITMDQTPTSTPAVLIVGKAQASGKVYFDRPLSIDQVSIVGQSLAIGACPNGDTAICNYISTTTPNPWGNSILGYSPSALTTLVENAGNIDPHSNQGGGAEHPRSGLANFWASASGRRFFIEDWDAVGGTAYTGLKKGTTPYANWLSALGGALGLVPSGYAYHFAGMVAEHGQQDFFIYTPATTYAADLAQWQSDMSADVLATTGDASSHPLFVSQWSAWYHYHTSTTPTTDTGAAGTPLGILAACRSNPGLIYCVEPEYQYRYEPTSGSVHLYSADYETHGEQIGKAMSWVFDRGQYWTGVQPRSITRSGAIITARFWVPVAPLAFDGTFGWGSDTLANKGFEYYNDGTPPAISSVTVSGDTVTITLASTPTGFTTERLRYAYTCTGAAGSSAGPHGNLRDSDATIGLRGQPLYNWAFTFDDAIPFSWSPS